MTLAALVPHTQAPLHGAGEPSDWVRRWSHLAKPRGRLLDIACGYGRHMAWFATLGCETMGIDRSAEAIAVAGQYGTCLQADIENGPWPLMQAGVPQPFDVVVVTNYLWRSLLPTIVQSVAPGGLLLYETFACGNETVGKPSRPDFLLQPAELLQTCQGLHVVAYENGFLPQPERFVQRIAAMAPTIDPGENREPVRHPLSLK
ncbi:MAG: class I SAM-dependent methyltransferase [Rhodoferax sp.]|nr:class I SAM-dependent methyltransferase [Rhodoferax sp.]